MFVGYRFEWRTSTSRVGYAAALASAATGILFAIVQVQGWTVPKPLALALIALMLLIIAGAVLLILVDLARNIRAFLEHRATSASWISDEPPGFLDYEVDGLRATDEFSSVITKLGEDTETLGKRLQRSTRRMQRAHRKSAKHRQRIANRTAKSITRSSIYIERRLDLLKKLLKEMERNHRGVVANLPVETEDERTSARAAREAIAGACAATAESRKSTEGYRDAVQTLEAQNASRTLRIATGRLKKALSGVATTLKTFEKLSAGLVAEFDKKLEGI